MSADLPVMLVVGGSGSIGSAVAAAAVACGWHVVLHGRTQASVNSKIESLRAPGADAAIKGICSDLTGEGAVERLVEDVARQCLRIDAVIDCMSTAPHSVVGRFEGTDPASYLRLAEVSVVHLQRLAHACLPWLARQGGTLVCFASDAGRFAAPHQALIGASRAAIMGFARNLAVEVAREKVRVHCISPSFVEGSAAAERASASRWSRMTTARARAGLGLPTAADIAPLVMFLCGDGAKCITGQVISVNGGLHA